jgi:hypothetical protein
MRTLAITLLTCAFALAADSPFVGNWTMNKAKSRIDPTLPKIDTLSVQVTQAGPAALKAVVTTNGTAAPVADIDGKEHAVTPTTTQPNTMGTTHYVSTLKGKTMDTVFKKDGKTVGTRKVSLSADGKTMTAVTDGTLLNGQKVHSSVVLDKQ